MRYALVENSLLEANPGSKGQCPGCSQSVTAVCGEKRIWHWRHHTLKNCDRWWEPETEWHRSWKEKFPKEWQEIFMPDKETGEKHMADVRTEHGMVIEFQHSHIDPLERMARERFYQNMVWVVDGTRLKRDYPRFQKGLDNFRKLNRDGFFCTLFADESFPANWLESSVPVIFDFQGTGLIDPPDALRNTLWCLLPGRAGRDAVIVGISRTDFVTTASSRSQLLPVQEILTALASNIQQPHKTGTPTPDYLLRQLAYQQRYRGYRGRRRF